MKWPINKREKEVQHHLMSYKVLKNVSGYLFYWKMHNLKKTVFSSIFIVNKRKIKRKSCSKSFTYNLLANLSWQQYKWSNAMHFWCLNHENNIFKIIFCIFMCFEVSLRWHLGAYVVHKLSKDIKVYTCSTLCEKLIREWEERSLFFKSDKITWTHLLVKLIETRQFFGSFKNAETD